jgi:pseudaminic acid synthase
MIKISKNLIFSTKDRPKIIAEISGNHNGKVKNLLNLIKVAKKNGADLVKIQTYEPEDITHKLVNYKIKDGPWKKKTLYELYKKNCTPYNWHEKIFSFAKKINIELFSTPFSLSGVKLLEKFNVKLYKLSSFEITDVNLITAIAKTKKPIIISTGMSKLSEIKNALKIINKYHKKVIILHCVSGYPTPIHEANIKNILFLKKNFPNYLIGLSDHTDDIYSSLASIPLGCSVIEKHFKSSNNIITDDTKFSINPEKLKNLREYSEKVFLSLGSKKKKLTSSEKLSLKFRRSIYAKRDIPKNKKIVTHDICSLRPKIGICASNYYKLLNKKTVRLVKKGEPLKWQYLEQKKNISN